MAQHAPMLAQANTPKRPKPRQRIDWLWTIAYAALFFTSATNLHTGFGALRQGDMFTAIFAFCSVILMALLILLLIIRDLRSVLKARKIHRLQAQYPVSWKKRSSL